MTKKWKIFGVQTNIEWYDVKTKFKQLLRKITYSWLFQELICLIFLSYMKFVYFTSKKIFINQEKAFEIAQNKTPMIFTFWHNRLMMTPFLTQKTKKLYPNHNFMTLASKHGDGRFVGKIMEKLSLVPIYGSSKNGRKASRGIDFSNLKKIINGLKDGNSLVITPDGPRGPNQKINGEVINIARLSGARVLAVACSSSRFKKLKTWDNFTVFLPFSTLCFYIDLEEIAVARNADESEMEKIKTVLENRINFLQEESQRIALA